MPGAPLAFTWHSAEVYIASQGRPATGAPRVRMYVASRGHVGAWA